MITMPASVTGSAQTGLTSPTYTLTADIPPSANGKQSAVTALGGTQTGVSVHSVAAPFTVSVFRPSQLAALGKPNPTTGVINSVPNNTYKVITRKGVLPLAGQAYVPAVFRTELSVPAGSDLADPANLRAALSAHIGFLNQLSAGIGDTTVNGVI